MKINVWEVICHPQEEAELVRWEDDTSDLNTLKNQTLDYSAMEE